MGLLKFLDDMTFGSTQHETAQDYTYCGGLGLLFSTVSFLGAIANACHGYVREAIEMAVFGGAITIPTTLCIKEGYKTWTKTECEFQERCSKEEDPYAHRRYISYD